MQIRRPLATTLLVAVMVSGCASPPVTRPTASPVPTTTPVFASEAEALEAAREAYAAYLEVSDQILAEGGSEPERLLDVASTDVLEKQMRGFTTAANTGLRTTGSTTVDSLTLQDSDLDAGRVVVYACVDVSQVDVLDSSGKSVVSSERPVRTPFEATFEVSQGRLKMAGEGVWSGTNFC